MQGFSVADITDKKTIVSQTTKEIASIERIEIIAVDRFFFLGIKYLKAKKN